MRLRCCTNIIKCNIYTSHHNSYLLSLCFFSSLGKGTPAERFYSQTSLLTLECYMWTQPLFFLSIPAIFSCLTGTNHEANGENKAYHFIREEVFLPKEGTACHAWSFSQVVLTDSPAEACSFFRTALLLPAPAEYQAVKSDRCSSGQRDWQARF